MGRSRVIVVVVRTLASIAVLAIQPVGASVANAAPPPAGRSAYVVTNLSSDATPIDVDAWQLAPAIPMGTSTFTSVAIAPDGAMAYTSSLVGSVAPIRLSTQTAEPRIYVGGAAGIAVTPDGTTAFVTDRATNRLVPITLATGAIGTAVPMNLGAGSTGVAIAPNGTTVYVANAFEGSVTVVDAVTSVVRTTVTLVPGSEKVQVSPDGRTAYVTNYTTGTLTPVDADTNIAGTPISVGGPAWSIAIAPDGIIAYVGTDTGVAEVDLATRVVRRTIPTSSEVRGLGVSPDGATIYAVLPLTDTAVSIDVATGTVSSPLAISGQPVDVAVVPDQAPVAALIVAPAPAGGATVFDASGSTVRYGTISTFTWDFGDGTVGVTSGPRVVHAYAQAGTYTASVTATSSGGTSTTRVFTGQSVVRNGGPSAIATIEVNVPPWTAAADILPVTGPNSRTLAFIAGAAGAILAGLGLIAASRSRAGRGS